MDSGPNLFGFVRVYCNPILPPAANTAIAISTYNMVSYTQKRAWDSQQVMWVWHLGFKVRHVFLVCTDDGFLAREGVGTNDIGW